jgi:hypothetical protein
MVELPTAYVREITQPTSKPVQRSPSAIFTIQFAPSIAAAQSRMTESVQGLAVAATGIAMPRNAVNSAALANLLDAVNIGTSLVVIVEDLCLATLTMNDLRSDLAELAADDLPVGRGNRTLPSEMVRSSSRKHSDSSSESRQRKFPENRFAEPFRQNRRELFRFSSGASDRRAT